MSARLAKQKGEWINRSTAVKFSFEGKEFSGFEGDSITSALWASGEQVIGRSFKYHRPRGILSFANHDVNIMLTDGMDTNIRGDVVPVRNGMALEAVNTDGGVKKDKNRFIDSISPLLPVGFYYKAFHTPRKLFPFWENIIRKAAGLGVVNFNYPRILKRKKHRHCDVLVIGAGASGLSAAYEAGKSGLRVMLVDENLQIGGSLGFDWGGTQEAANLLKDLLAKVESLPNVEVIAAAYAAGYYPDHLIPVVTADGMIKVRANAVIMASGAFEQPPVFRNNDIPGVMLGSAAQRLLHRYSVKPFSNGVVFTANDYGYRVAQDLLEAGIKVAAVVDLRSDAKDGPLAAQLARRGVKTISGSCIYEVQPNAGKTGVKSVTVAEYDEKLNEALTRSKVTIDCDGVAMCAGWAPAANLLYQAGTAMRYDYGVHQFVPNKLPAGIFAAGRVNGVYALEQKVQDGARAASLALRHIGLGTPELSSVSPSNTAQSHEYPVVPHPKGKNFVDFDEDIQVKDFINAAKEGFDNIELMKRFTTVGMGPSQGKHSNMNAIRILARVRGVPVEQIGTTTSRPFFHPTPIGHLGGRGFHPHRLTPLHDMNHKLGAVFTDVGAWKRAAYYQVPGLSLADTVLAEVEAVRTKAGIIDSSSFGKIEVHGPDAALFLERFFTGSYSVQPVGSSRYTMLLDESGVVIDDGLAHRLADDLFYLSSGTSNAAAVYREMQRWQQMWQLDIGLVNVTGSYAAINIAGPLARQVLSGLVNVSLDESAMPAQSICEAEIAGVPVRLIRVVFVSDTTYELHIPTPQAAFVWERVMGAGHALGLKPFGTDAQRLLRLEMGHAMPGIDTDGLTNPYEIGADHALSLDKPDFIGKRSLQIIAKRPLKKILVAFALDAGYAGEMPFECNLVIRDGEIEGRVTSIAYSRTVGRVIGFAYVAPDHSALESRFQIRADSGALVSATVVSSHFIAMQK
ncbi:FAD-dependent oxidoreductase [Methylobacillus gramineus]|uniref:2Fe-2S iron-sulfur cluster-binding protein n=1 Tax=Methylobacillus gramineus TaxID=755169 RepID=UPI001CFF99BE|nr:2Fe-2S iron-sulfur cluster-binding protein [Methylobacillus gramineus]MCB5185222.1 FAD-dependent oxidoreductase [Methylobacillus gramineus]